ncbi:hypothetical protein L2E82_42883 [Cichorium intybus]|uniref:Uncharacterized protein n=1 Tax=Cichorium intybus TaxID=13427 RepID=A0ACB8ZLS7_CICIN|nr:hypothetical protein L2E82_42883 [Cichorium intybus]
MASSSRAPVSYAAAEGVLAGTVILVLCVQIFALEVVAVEIGVSLLMVFLSVGFIFLVIVLKRAKTTIIASVRFAFLLIHLVSFDRCLRLRPSSHPISMQTLAIVLTIAAIQLLMSKRLAMNHYIFTVGSSIGCLE